MKKLILVVLLFSICFVQGINAQEENVDNPVFNNDGLTYDSIMGIIQDKDIEFNDKFEAVRDIMVVFPLNKLTEVHHAILSLAKKEKDKRYVCDLYSALANLYILHDSLEEGKNYIDSAFVYENKIDHIPSLALMNYIMSSYYNVLGEEDKAHEYLYKTIEYFEQTEGKKSTAITLLFRLSQSYAIHKDTNSLKKNMDRMIILSKEIKEDLSYINTYTVVRIYYELLFNESEDVQYQDSIVKYGKKIESIYKRTDEMTKKIVESLSIGNYLALAEIISNLPNPDWAKVVYYLKLAEELHDKASSMQRGMTHNTIAIYRLRSKVLFHNGNVDEALTVALKSLHLMEQQLTEGNLVQHVNTYLLLLNIYEKKGDYQSAFKYSKMLNAKGAILNRERKFKIVKDLETKYETAQKELEIHKLNDEKKTLAFERTLLIGGAIILGILLLSLMLYLRIKRLQQEKLAALMQTRIEQKKKEFQVLQKDSEVNMMKSYIEGLEVERYRLSRDLHDDISNELVVIKMQVENEMPPAQKLIHVLDKLQTNVRSISHGLIPPAFQHASLKEVLEDYLMQLNNKITAKVIVNIQPEANWKSIPEKISVEAYRIVQEATGNAIKHAKASEIKINANYIDDNTLHISIEDNGIGFNPEKMHPGLGLKILKERVELVGGHLAIESSPGLGTKIQVSIPLQLL